MVGSEIELVSTSGGKRVGNQHRARSDEPPATTTPAGLPGWGPRSAGGTDLFCGVIGTGVRR